MFWQRRRRRLLLMVAAKVTCRRQRRSCQESTAPATSLVADKLVDVLVGLGPAHTSREVATDFVFELERRDCSRAG